MLNLTITGVEFAEYIMDCKHNISTEGYASLEIVNGKHHIHSFENVKVPVSIS